MGELLWLLTHLTSSKTSTLELIATDNGLVNVLMGCVSKVPFGHEDYLFIVLPAVRCIGMWVCVVHVCMCVKTWSSKVMCCFGYLRNKLLM